jgi:hypothetical protein
MQVNIFFIGLSRKIPALMPFSTKQGHGIKRQYNVYIKNTDQ